MVAGRRKEPRTWCGPGRLRCAVCVGVVAWMVLVGRLVQVQGFMGEAYAQKAHDQYMRLIELKASRGSVLDRRGTELATDTRASSFYAHPERIVAPERIAAHFAPYSHQSAAVLQRQLARNSGRSFVYLARQVADSELAQVQSVDFTGVFSHAETQRYYPLRALAGQVLGHTSIDNEGREGIERQFDADLRERDGTLVSYVDARGHRVPGRSEAQVEPENGRDLVLTLDALYQGILEEELLRTIEKVDATSAMGIIVDPRTGEVLAMANVPLFDPNAAGRSPAALRRNRVVTDAWEPGSTFKVIAAAAVVEDGLAQLHERVYCEDGVLELANGETIRDITPYGELSFVEVIENSSNIGLIKFARRLSRARYYEYIRRFGFASRSGIELPAESIGLLQRVDRWSERSLETIAIGQEISVTMLQLAQAYAAIANGGQLMAPQMIKGYIGASGQVEGGSAPRVLRRVISEQTALTMRHILQGVVERGTGKRARIEGISVAGKTGTAQKAAREGGGYDPEANIVSFAGFLPVEEPQYVCIIAVDEPRLEKWGGSVAAPAFQRVMRRILHLPGGLLAGRGNDVALGGAISVPDLRGMTSEAARFAAQLRGVRIVVVGDGNVITAQSPLPGEAITPGTGIRCTLGFSAGLYDGGADMPLRQAHLLEMMRPPRAAKLTRGL